jgi:hypothetical protein
MLSSARRPASQRLARALLACACATGVAAAVAWVATDDADSTADAEPALAAPPASTIAPLAADDPRASLAPTDDEIQTPPATATSSVPSAPPTTALSPLAELLGEQGSVIPEAIEPRVQPAALVIEDIGVFHPVRPVGLEDDGQLEVPDETQIGWYRYGSAPGRPGATVLAAHVTWNRTSGPFLYLRDLEPGGRIDVALADGTVRTYQAVERAVYGKDDLPRDRIWRTTGDETLVLITCGGSYNPEIRRYRENVVVYAVPVAQTDADTRGRT